ncbi:LysR substrate-binding domain-containing protein [Niveibacterium sp. 24ML]|uniref:LysR substrate-binding domain-containing protein n=1 Tax=Niveibacterium sp. 24ML TaxID=2985512 RepID=UPI0022707601|nr:LysR substrate-binding domain-containing protein [Niveibacterium sp. 24ML]MCX9154532.1 LysR substrate-binding domain-containing protein [Niveibacterium sp. 24ML]
MASNSWDSMDVHLLRVLHAVLAECSVTKAALRLNQSQPAVSTALRRLRDITGDQLLVRSRNGMTPTERGAALLEPVKLALAQIESIAVKQVRFDPAKSRRVFNIATPDYLNAVILGEVVARLRKFAPHSQVVFHSLGPDSDFTQALESGELDVVIGNWPQPPELLRMTSLFEDDLVCVMRKDHPYAKRPLTTERYLEAEHLAPTPYSVGRRGVIDMHLARERIKRNVVAYVPYFGLVPYLLLQTDMIFTGPRVFAEHFAKLMPLAVTEVPIDFPKMNFYLLWHDRTHLADECRWFREQIVSVARKPQESSLTAAA